MRNLLNFKHLRYFWAVAHHGNLTRAAGALNVSQSALSIQIQKLEQQLGHDLFERRGKSLHLTEAGRIALDHADTIFAAGDELVGTLEQNRPGKRQTLKIGAEATLSRNFQMGFLKPLGGREDVRVSIESGRVDALLRALESHRLDVVLTNHPPVRDAETPWVAKELARQPIALVASARIAHESLSLETIINRFPLILPGRGSPARDRFDAFVNHAGLVPKIAAEVDDMAMLRLLACEGSSVAVIPPIVVQQELRSGQLRQIGAMEGLYEEFYAVTLARRFPNPILNMLLENAALSAQDTYQTAP